MSHSVRRRVQQFGRLINTSGFRHIGGRASGMQNRGFFQQAVRADAIDRSGQIRIDPEGGRTDIQQRDDVPFFKLGQGDLLCHQAGGTSDVVIVLL